MNAMRVRGSSGHLGLVSMLLAMGLFVGCGGGGGGGDDCDPGYTGPDCTECADGFHRNADGNCVADETCQPYSCSYHGTCDDTTGEVVCACETGYDGTHCDRCAPGYTRDHTGECTPDAGCGPNTCSGHGACSDATGTPVCTCDTGYAGTHCERCDDGYMDNGNGACVPSADCRADSCNYHGICDDSSGAVVCTCQAAYAGNYCERCAAGYFDDGSGKCAPAQSCEADSCSGNGTCSDAGGQIVCTCNTGYGGTTCDRCAAGYHDQGGTCVQDNTCLPTTCNHHGTCSDSSGSPRCTCEQGYAGTYCDRCADNYHMDSGGKCVRDTGCEADSCNHHGTCSDSSGSIVCDCNTGYSGSRCDRCASGYHPEDNRCVADESCEADTCNSHGSCDDSSGSIECSCNVGYAGDRCQRCAAGYHLDGSRCVRDEQCLSNTCNNHGTCSDSSGEPVCTCHTGYTGDACDDCAAGYHDDGDGNCVSCLPNCSGRNCGDDGCGGTCGTCSGGKVCENGQCTCASHATRQCHLDDVWWFDSCGDPEEKIADCENGCANAQCTNCTPNCTGRECGPDPVCGTTCPPGCSGNEECDNGVCGCESHAEQRCHEDDVWWFDSCGDPEEKITDCDRGCSNGMCLDCTPDCVGRECDPDPECGISCGTCTGGEECENAQCRCTSHDSQACHDGHVYWFDSCGEPEERIATCESGCHNGECQSCTPDCTGRECGLDPVCGVSCGTCSGGADCVDNSCQCTSNAYSECHQGDVWWFDSCGSPETMQFDCTEGCQGGQCLHGCTPNCTGRECGLDPLCGISCGECRDGKECESGACACTPQDHTACHQGNVWWFDSCGSPETMLTSCANGCQDGECINCTPDCAGRNCGPDPVCGSSCGDCTGGQECQSSGSCACTSQASSDCHQGDVWWFDSCGSPETMQFDCPGDCQGGQCVHGCTPDCAGRDCGLDPVCGVSCGSCTGGEVCQANNTCQCTSHADTRCHNGDVYWFDSCGSPETMQFDCTEGCANGECVHCVPNCTDRECGPDPACGTSCGVCIGGEDCRSGRCECSPQATRGCHNDDVYWFDSCGNPGSLIADCTGGCQSGECIDCVPDCTGRECGLDPVCGVSCGTCSGGADCVGTSCQCTSHAYSECHSGDVWWFDSCGQPETMQFDCTEGCQGGQCLHGCTPNCTGRECGVDPLCGISCGECRDGKECESGTCTCTPQDHTACHEGNVWWFDSCNNPQALLTSCANGCQDDECINCTPNCAGRNCGPDPVCGSSCGDCTGGQECQPSGSCSCTSQASSDCHQGDVWWFDSCGSPETMQFDCPNDCQGGQCVHDCTPDCSGRDCGLDPECGVSCGGCTGGEVCQTNGTCQCTSHADTRCHNGDVWWFDSCGDPESLQVSCPQGCTSGECTHDCVPNCTGLECGPDPNCGDSCGTCSGGRECEDGDCECTSHASHDCYSGDVWWFDSCGEPEEVLADCDEDCEHRECTNCDPDCVWRECGEEEECGTNCGDCSGGRECWHGLCMCMSHHETKCHEGNVWWFDSCGAPEEPVAYCEHGCTGATCDECIPDCGGRDCGPDADCGLSCGECTGGKECEGGLCQCTSHHHLDCYNGDLWWFHSCGGHEELAVDCENGCLNSECTNCTNPDCSGRECGPDPVCGTNCGVCADGADCDEDTGRCGCTSHAYTDCHENNVWWFDSCNTPEELHTTCANGCAEATCEDCTPDCSGRECGPDPVCGETCGTCADGRDCNDAGMCVCDPGASFGCHQGNVWIFDSCGNPENEVEACIGGCVDGECVSVGTCSAMATLSCNTVLAGSNHGSSNNMESYSCNAWSETGPEYVYSFTPAQSGATMITISAMTADLDVMVLTPDCDPNQCIGSGDEWVGIMAQAGTTYYVVVDGFLGAGSDFHIIADCDWADSEVCDDDIDNNFDGETDCDDIACCGNPLCPPCEICYDHIDNNGDGDTDCEDLLCDGDPACPDCRPVGAISCGDVVNGSNFGLTNRMEDYGCAGWHEPGPEVVYSFVPPAEIPVTFSLSNMTQDMDVFVLEGGCDTDRCIAHGDDSASFDALSGFAYYVVVDGFWGNTSEFTLTVECQAYEAGHCGDDVDNDFDTLTDCADPDCSGDPLCQGCTPISIIDCNQSISFSTVGQPSVIHGYPCAAWDEGGPEAAFEFYSDKVQDITLDLATDADLDVFVLRNACASEACIEAGDAIIEFRAEDGDRLYFVVDGYGGAEGGFNLDITCTPVDANCTVGYQDNDGDGTCDPDCRLAIQDGLDCHDHSHCEDDTGHAICVCDPGYINDGPDACILDPDATGDSCDHPIGLAPGEDVTVTTDFSGKPASTEGSCGGEGPEVVYAFSIASRHCSSFLGIEAGGYLYLRTDCDDPSPIDLNGNGSEAVCKGDGLHSPLFSTRLPAGTYYLIFDSAAGFSGTMDLNYTLKPYPCFPNPCHPTEQCTTDETCSSVICSCPDGTISDPAEGCVDDPCRPNPCTDAHKTMCEPDIGNDPNYTCSCIPAYHDDGAGNCVQDVAGNAKWTWFIFWNSETDLGIFYDIYLNDLAEIGSTSDVHVVMLADAPDITTRVFYIKHKDQGGAILVEDWDELDMGDPATLVRFGQWAPANYPANKYFMTIFDHGSGWRHDGAPSPTTRGISWDDDPTSGSFISISKGQLAEALSQINASTGKLPLLGFHACLMGQWEVAVSVAPYADYMIASEETGWVFHSGAEGWDYISVLRDLTNDPDMDAQTLGTKVVEYHFVAHANNWTLALTDLNKAESLISAMDQLGQALLDHPERYPEIDAMHPDIQGFACLPEDGTFKDVIHFATLLLDLPNLPQNIQDAANTVIANFNDAIVFNRVQSTYPGAFGLSTYLPSCIDDFIPEYQNNAGAVWSQRTQWDEFVRAFTTSDCEPPDTCVALESITCGQTINAHNGGGSIDMVNYLCGDKNPFGPEYPVEWDPEKGAIATVTLSGMSEDLDLYVLDGECNTNRTRICSTNESGDEMVEFKVNAGEVHYFVVDGHDLATSDFSLTLDCIIEDCVDGEDNDGDYKIDCADPDCDDDPNCGAETGRCDDDIDNDGDAATDCWDLDCQNDAACQICTESETIACGQTKSGDTTGGSSVMNDYSCSDWDESGPERVYKFEPTHSTGVAALIHDIEEGQDLDIFILENSCSPETCKRGDNVESNWVANEGKAYYIVVDGYSGAAGSFQITLTCAD